MYVYEVIKYLKQFEMDDEVKVSAIVDLSSFDDDYLEKGYAIIEGEIIEGNPDEEVPTLMVIDENHKGKIVED
jgi:uncharacterized protein YuzB (UPF0349 family)